MKRLALLLIAAAALAGNLQTIPGQGMWMPSSPPYMALSPQFSNALVIDATGEKIAFCGRYWNRDHASKDIRRAGFLFGAVTKAGGSGLTVSLQDASLTSGPPMQPDGTQDQTVAVANGDIASGWYRTGALSADRTLTPGNLVCVVIEYDGGGRQGSDSVVVQGLTSSSSGPLLHTTSVLYTTAWATQSAIPNVVLEATDGSFGTMEGAFPASAVGMLSFHLNSATDEYALEFTLPGPVKIDALYAAARAEAASSDFEMVLYTGTTNAVTIDGNATAVSGTARYLFAPLAAEVTLAKDTTYRVSLRPTTANQVSLYYFDVANADHFQAHAGGSGWHMASRADQGSWSSTPATRRPFLGVRISAIDDGTGSGGGTRVCASVQ